MRSRMIGRPGGLAAGSERHDRAHGCDEGFRIAALGQRQTAWDPRELPPAFLDTPLPEEPAMVKLSMNELNELLLRLMGLWSARAGAARPRCPQASATPARAARRRPRPDLARWRRGGAGARGASARGCCGYCGARRRSYSRASWPCRSTSWSSGVPKPRWHSTARSRTVRASLPTASLPPPCSASASCRWRTSCCARASSAPALWPGGGRADGRYDLPCYWPALRHRPRLSGLAAAALVLLCRAPDAGRGRHASRHAAPTTRAEACHLRRGLARGYQG